MLIFWYEYLYIVKQYIYIAMFIMNLAIFQNIVIIKLLQSIYIVYVT